MNEGTKEELNKITKKVSDIYQKVFSEEKGENCNSQWFEADLNIMYKQLENIKRGLDDKLSALYDNGANEIDPEVNQLQREIQEINNWVEDIIPDLLTYINEIKGDSKKIESAADELQIEEEIVEESTQGMNEDLEEQIQEAEEMIEETEEAIEEIQEVEPQIPETIQKKEDIASQDNKKIVTIKLGQPSNDYKNIAKNIIEARNGNLQEPSKAIENGSFASGQVIESIKNILLKDI